jgi:hypothetical protein
MPVTFTEAVVVDDEPHYRERVPQMIAEATGLEPSDITVLGADEIVPTLAEIAERTKGRSTLVVSDRSLTFGGNEGVGIVTAAKDAMASNIALFSGNIPRATRGRLEQAGIACVNKASSRPDEDGVARLRRWVQQAVDPDSIPTADTYQAYRDIKYMISGLVLYCFPDGPDARPKDFNLDALVASHPHLFYGQMDVDALVAENNRYFDLVMRDLPPLGTACLNFFQDGRRVGYLPNDRLHTAAGWVDSTLERLKKESAKYRY